MSADFGLDLSCTYDLDQRCITVTGRRLLAEAIFRRLITPRGRLIGDPNYGTDITQYLNDDVSPSDIAEMRAAIRAECKKDERIDDCTVTITAPAGKTGTYTIVISLEDGDGPFDLVLAVSNVTVEILNLENI